MSAIRLVLPSGSFDQSAGLDAESMRTTPYLRMPMSRSVLPIAHALRTCVTNFLRSSSLPIAEPPPVGGQTGATKDPTASPFAAILSASRFNSAPVASMLTCGSKRNRSTPSNATPLTDVFAVRSSIVSRSIGGSAPGFPCRRGRATSRCEVCGYVVHRFPLAATVRRPDWPGPKCFRITSGSVSLVFSTRTPVCAAVAVTNSSSSVDWP